MKLSIKIDGTGGVPLLPCTVPTLEGTRVDDTSVVDPVPTYEIC